MSISDDDATSQSSVEGEPTEEEADNPIEPSEISSTDREGPSNAQEPEVVSSSSQEPPVVFLDPAMGREIPLTPPRRPVRRPLRRLYRRLYLGFLTCAGITFLVVVVVHFRNEWTSSSTRPTPSGLSALRDDDSPAMAVPAPSASGEKVTDDAPSEPGPWRISAWAADESVRIVHGKMGDKSLVDTLTEAHVPKAQVFRILNSFGDPRRFDKPKKTDTYVVALDRATKRVRAFEYQTSVAEVWQSRELEDGRLVGSKLDLHVLQRRVAKAVMVKDDLRAAVVEAGFDDDILDTLDDALEDRMALASVQRGAVLRIVAQEQTVLGKFARYVEIEAVEYLPPKMDAASVRVYHVKDGKNKGYYDARGHAPYKGGWRHPVKFPRITSRFNPKRLHPVLHVVMPHNGCDFGAPTGTPVYAASHGVVAHVGPMGPSGNLVLIDHQGGMQTGYAHLSRFAAGLKQGEKVDTRQLVGYAGSTGRSTGAHLHFSLKKNGVFVDPLGLKMDGERVLPKEEREAFDVLRSGLDGVLDSIPRPAPLTDIPAEPDDQDSINGEESDSGAPAPGASGAAAEPKPAAPASSSSPVTSGSLDSAVWKPAP